MRMKKKVVGFTLVFAMLFTASCTGEKEVSEVTTTTNVTVDAVTVADNKGYEGKYPGQFELDEFEKMTGETLSFSDNPLFSDMEIRVADRLPSEPLVMAPEFEVGKYGGMLKVLSRAPENGTTGVLSMRHVNLVRIAGDYETVVPDIAESFEYNDDFTELTVTLREGHKWSDGQPFTTEDIMFWWEDIQLYEDLNKIVKAQWQFGGEPMEVTAIDATTIKFSFAVPSPGFILMLAVDPVQPFQPKHVLKEFHKKYNPDVDVLAESLGYKSWQILFSVYYNDRKYGYHPLSGKRPIEVPTLESHVLYKETTEHRMFKANPYYHIVDTVGNQLPYIDEIYEVFIEDTGIKNLKVSRGEIDFKAHNMELADYPYLKKHMEDGDYDIRLVSSHSGAAPGFNLNHKDPVLRKLFNNLKFKQAMSLALNRDEINELIFLGMGTPMAAIPGSPERNEFITKAMTTYMTDYDVYRANNLLDEIGLEKRERGLRIREKGFRLREDGKPLIIYVTYSAGAGDVRLWQLIKEYWEAVGVRVELKEVSSDLYLRELRNNNLDLSTWYSVGGEPPKYYDVDRTPFLPTGRTTAMALYWANWIKSGGTEGEKPPQDILDLLDLYNEFIQQGYQSEKYNQLAKQMSGIVVEQMFLIGTVGEIKIPIIVHNRMGNIGEIKIAGMPYYCNYPLRPCQWYFKY